MRKSVIRRIMCNIAKAELRILELESALLDFEELRVRLAEIESYLHEKESDLVRNAEYISKAELRISELEIALFDFEELRARLVELESSLHEKEAGAIHNEKYIAQCHTRIAELDDIFSHQRNNYLSALDSISQLEQKLSNRNAELFSVMDDFTAQKIRIDALLSWRIVRMLDRNLSKRAR